MGEHYCHWPNCSQQVPPKLWGCKTHWSKLPATLRAAIWRSYRPGQETDKQPSPEYLQVARAVQNWIKEQVAPTPSSARREG